MLALTVLAIVATIIAFTALDFWWKADRFLCDERARRVKAERALRSFPTLPPVFNADAAASAFVIWKARTVPGIEILCGTATLSEADACMSVLEQVIDSSDLGGDLAGRLAITHRPGEIRFANGSRIQVRFSNSGRGFKGLRPTWTWWAADGKPDLELMRLNERHQTPPAWPKGPDGAERDLQRR